MIVIQDNKSGHYFATSTSYKGKAYAIFDMDINYAQTYKTIEAAASDVAYLKKLGYDCEWKEIK